MLNIKKVDSVYQFHQYQLQNINANLLVQYKKLLCIPSERNAAGRQFLGRWDLEQGKRLVWNLYIGTVLLACVAIAPVVPISICHLETFGKILKHYLMARLHRKLITKSSIATRLSYHVM